MPPMQGGCFLRLTGTVLNLELPMSVQLTRVWLEYYEEKQGEICGTWRGSSAASFHYLLPSRYLEHEQPTVSAARRPFGDFALGRQAISGRRFKQFGCPCQR